MAATGTINIIGEIDGLPSGSKSIDLVVTLAAAVDASSLVNFASGDNTFTAPAGASFLLLIPPGTNTATFKLKGAGGDTGFPAGIPTNPSMIPVNGGGTVIINSTAIVNGVTLAWL